MDVVSHTDLPPERSEIAEQAPDQTDDASHSSAVPDLSPIYRLVLDSMTEGVSVSTEDGTIIYTNGAEDRIFGYRPGELIGCNITVQDAYPPEENEQRVREVVAELQVNGSWTGEWLNKKKNGTPFYTHSRITALHLDGKQHWVCVQRDITDQKRAAAAREMTERQLLLLIEASSSLLTSPQSSEVLRTIIELAQRFVAANGYAVWRKGQGGEAWVLASSAGLSEEFVRSGMITPAYAPRIASTPLVVEDITQEPLLESRREALVREGVRSMLIIPLHIQEQFTGTVVFYWRSKHHLSDAEVRIAWALGNLATSGLRTAELYERQLELREAAQAAERRAAFLAEAGAVLASSLDYEATLASVVRLAVPTFADWAAVDILDESGQVRRVAVTHNDPEKVRFAYEFSELYPPREEDAPRVALRTGKSLLLENMN